MTTRAQLRKAALALPEVEEGTHFGLPAFLVRGKRFASITPDGAVHLNLPKSEADEVAQTYDTSETITRGTSVIGVGVPLADINGMALNHWVRRAWFHRAPRRLTDALAGADRADVGAGNLPGAIGRPATRALVGAGITSLEDLSRWTEEAVADLHGVGPKAVRILADSLAAQGKSFTRGAH